MGSLMAVSGSNGVPEAVQNALQFLDEIDGNALSEAMMCPKPKIDPEPHTFWHGGDLWLSMKGKICLYDPWDPDYNEW